MPVLFDKPQGWFDTCLVSIHIEDRFSVIVTLPDLCNTHLVKCLQWLPTFPEWSQLVDHQKDSWPLKRALAKYRGPIHVWFAYSTKVKAKERQIGVKMYPACEKPRLEEGRGLFAFLAWESLVQQVTDRRNLKEHYLLFHKHLCLLMLAYRHR